MFYLLFFNILFFAFVTWRRFDIGISLLFLLLPAYLIRLNFGALPSTLLEIMIWVVFVIWIIKIYKHSSLKAWFTTLKHIIKQNPSLFIAIFLFLLAATISIFTSINTRSALGEWKAFYIEPFLIFIILITYLKEEKQINNIIFALIISGLATSLLSIFQHFTGWMVPWEFWENRNTYRVTGWYGYPNAVGLFLAPLVPLAIHFVKQNKNKLYFFTSIIFIPCAILAIFFAKSTGGLIGVLSGITLLLIFWKKTRKYILIFGVLSLLVLIFMPNNPVRDELLMQDNSGQMRIAMWGETIEFLTNHPINGAGLASYKTLIYPYRVDKWIEVFHHPHNIFLTMWVNLGLLGLIGFVWILVWYFRIGFQNLQATSYRLTPNLLASMTAIIITGLVDSPYIKNDLALIFWLLPALMIISTATTRQEEIN